MTEAYRAPLVDPVIDLHHFRNERGRQTEKYCPGSGKSVVIESITWWKQEGKGADPTQPDGVVTTREVPIKLCPTCNTQPRVVSLRTYQTLYKATSEVE